MRSVCALLALVCGGWVQSAVPHCLTTGPSAATSASVQERAHSNHGNGAVDPAADRHGTEAEGGSSPHSDASCMLIMGCGSALMITPVGPATAVPAPTIGTSSPVRVARHATAFPVHEPPPPRLLV